MRQILAKIIQHNVLHARWLNTLSFMENAGARKISDCENVELVDIIQLKHAAEEHRHAYYLKKQLSKLDIKGFESYRNTDLLSGISTRQYLHRLDVLCSRYLKTKLGIRGEKLRYAAYLLVTYAIEIRADELYPCYQEELTRSNSKVVVKSIILEEEGHLKEMILQMEKFFGGWKAYAKDVLQIEQALFEEWFAVISNEVLQYEQDTTVLV